MPIRRHYLYSALLSLLLLYYNYSTTRAGGCRPMLNFDSYDNNMTLLHANNTDNVQKSI